MGTKPKQPEFTAPHPYVVVWMAVAVKKNLRAPRLKPAYTKFIALCDNYDIEPTKDEFEIYLNLVASAIDASDLGLEVAIEEAFMAGAEQYLKGKKKRKKATTPRKKTTKKKSDDNRFDLDI